MNDGHDAVQLLTDGQPELLAFIRRRARGRLLRYETAEDLSQAVTARALSGLSGFSGTDPKHFWAWLFKITLNHLDDRRDYWFALKRSATPVLRMAADGSWSGDVDEPATSVSGPATRAERRDLLVQVAHGLARLTERDRRLLQLASGGATDAELGAEFNMDTNSAGRAKRRALERLRALWPRDEKH